MKKYILAAVLLAAAGTAFIVFKSSPEDKLLSALSAVVGEENSVQIDGCTLSVSVTKSGSDDAQIGHVHLTLRADLRLYALDTVRLLSSNDSVKLRILRGPVTEDMVSQVQAIVDVGGDRLRALLGEPDAIRKFLENEGSKLFTRVMSTVTEDNGTQRLVAHRDAPEFYQFAKKVEALPNPISYQATTSFGPGEPSAQSLLSAEIAMVPELIFSMKTQEDAKALAHAFHDFAKDADCL